MIANDQELTVTLERIARSHAQLAHLRRIESGPASFRASASGFLADVDRMQLEVREYLSRRPSEQAPTTWRSTGVDARWRGAGVRDSAVELSPIPNRACATTSPGVSPLTRQP